MKYIIVTIYLFLSFSCNADDTGENEAYTKQSHEITKEGSIEGLKKSILVDDGFDESQIKDMATTAFRFPSVNDNGCTAAVRPNLCEWGKAADDTVVNPKDSVPKDGDD